MENKKEIFNLPLWEELPDIELYMDQLIGYLEKKLSFLNDTEDEKFITSTMINNYVKKKIILAPEKKKYNKEHLAYLFIIITLKRVFTISQISSLIKNITKEDEISVAYNNFCYQMKNAYDFVFDTKENKEFVKNDTALYNASLAYAYKMYTEKLL